MPRDSSVYAGNVTAIYRDLARSQAEAKLRKGAGWQQALGELGQIAGNLPGQIADEKIFKANLARFKQQQQEDQWLADAMNSSFDPSTGEIDERRLSENLNVIGASQLAPKALETLRQAKEAKIRLQNAVQTGQLNTAALAKLQSEALAPYAKALVESQGDPAVLNASLAAIRLQLGPEMADALQQKITENPDGVLPFAQSLIQKAPVKTTSLAKGAKLVNEETGALIAENPDVETPGVLSLDDQLAAAFKSGDRATINAIVKLKAEIAAGNRAPTQGPQPNYQRIETVDEAGNPIIRYMTPEQVNAQGGVRTTPKTTAKAGAPATVEAILGEIATLSKKINTSAGGPMANVTGLARRAGAAMNMDNDVSEYQALVDGFTPIMARAVGHTGVLTQLDVESVQRLFPKPTDNQQLAQNKLDRVRRIMAAMQDPTVTALGPDASFADKLGAAMSIVSKTPRSGGAGPTGRGGGAPADPLGIRKGGG